MRYAIAAVVVTGTLTITPLAGFAATPGQQARPASQAPKAQQATPAAKPEAKPARTEAASHVTTGVVKSINATTLVMTRSGKGSGEMTFEVNTFTRRDGTIEVGAPVSVRYREEGKNHIATALTVQHPKQQAAAHNVPSAR